MTDNLKVVILAAGKGKRLQSEETQIPKHMREVAGKPILEYVLKSVDFIDKKDIIIVVGFKKEMITEAFPEYMFAIQEETNPLGYGTGAAVRYAERIIGDFDGDILVLMGDSPLVTKNTLLNLYDEHKKNNNDLRSTN
jgi:bifunctional N-acetylglucosamine-1-phosphate-uridyltransferase/glucosamine-1-phosphate-acetyltransferase GlmU-like protein